ncbi:MAG: hypothetical protein CMP23_13800 [Rickettsiales bacterium]|nr:hypothetical protein [Rickettsiales bacterium]
MLLIGLLYIILAWIWCAYLPGYLLSRLLIPAADGAERQGFALLCGFSTVPLLVFLGTVALGIPMNGMLIFASSSVLNIAGMALLSRRPGGLQLGLEPRSCGILLGSAVAIGALVLFGIRSLDGGDVFSTIHHCLYVIVMHAIGNDPSSSMPLYDGISDGPIHYLVQHPTDKFNGLASLFYEQRLGNAPILAGGVALFGTAGWLLTTVTASLVLAVCCFLIGRELGAGDWASALATAVFVYGSHHFLGYLVNENLYAMTLVSFLLWTALRARLSWGAVLLIGISAGHLVGVRHPSVLFWPAIALGLLWRPGPRTDTLRRFAVALLLALLFLAPWLYVNQIMLGNLLDHPKIHPESTDRIVENSLLGWNFAFRALNWPFIESISRTAWNPLPSFLWLPLWAGKCYGQLSLALALLGLWCLKGQRRTLAILAGFIIPHTAAIGLLESLDWEQLTYAAPSLVPIAGLMACALASLADPTGRRRRLLQSTALLLGVILLSAASAQLRFPVDTRLLSAQDWPEPPTEDRGVQAVRDWLTRPSPLPKRPLLRPKSARAALRSFAHALPSRQDRNAQGLPRYPSGRVALLAGYSSTDGSRYNFSLQGGKLRQPEQSIRTSLGLHLVSLQLPATEAEASIKWVQGAYHVDFTPTVPAAELHDFSLYLHPWFPPARIIRVSVAGETVTNLRVLEYGGSREDGERRFMVTNYPAEVLDVMQLPFTVDPLGEKPACGIFLFSWGTGPERIETMISSGGHDQSWHGELNGVLSVPRDILADTVVLFSEPYCSDHVPQYGDRYGLARAPFSPEKGLHFRLDRTW